MQLRSAACWAGWKSSEKQQGREGIFIYLFVYLFILSSKITEDSDYCHEINRHLLLGREVMTDLDSILKSRDITLSTKIHLVKGMFFQ